MNPRITEASWYTNPLYQHSQINVETPSYPRHAGFEVSHVTASAPKLTHRDIYISRSKLFDSKPSASLDEQRVEAERNWLEHTTQFRESLTHSLMRRKNFDQEQRRAAPKYTFF